MSQTLGVHALWCYLYIKCHRVLSFDTLSDLVLQVFVLYFNELYISVLQFINLIKLASQIRVLECIP